MNGGDVGEPGSEELNEKVRRAGCADTDGRAGEPFEAEPAVADEGA